MTRTNSINRLLSKMLVTTMIFFILFSGIGAAVTYNVPENGLTIQEVINAASANDIIYVNSGTYQENVVVDKTGLVLIGKDTGSGKPVVDAMGSGHAISVTANDVTINGFNPTNTTAMGYGILISSSNNMLTGNTVNNMYIGIYLQSSSNNMLTGNNVSDNEFGIYLQSSNNNMLTGNTASNNNYGIYLQSSSNNILTGNSATSNTEGISLSSSSNNNTLTGNSATLNTEGISLVSSNDNQIYNNGFINTYNAEDNGNNIWNITPTSGTNIIGESWLGGNYWSDYAGVDKINDDGLGDTLTPYNSWGNISNGGDYHPLFDNTLPVSTIDQSDDMPDAEEEASDDMPDAEEEASDDMPDTEEEASGLPGFSIIMGILGIVSAILVRRK